MRPLALVLALALLPARASAEEETKQTSPLVYVGFGMAGVGVVVGALFGADSLQAASAASEQCVGNRCPPSSFHFIDQSRTSAAIADVAFGVAAIGVGIGIYGLLARPSKDLEKPDPHPAPPGISLRIVPGGLGLTAAF